MTCHPRRVLFVLLALSLILLALGMGLGRAHQIMVKTAVAPAGPIAPNRGANSDGFLNSGISLPKDQKGRKRAIEAAKDYIKDKKWNIAIPHLQKLVEIDEDVFVHLTRSNAEGKDVLAWVSVKQEADRLIGSLPADGMDFYKLTYGAKAADMLKKAKKSGDPSGLADIMKKYAHTDAGGEAIQLLADYHLDRGNYIAAVLCYGKLFRRQGADKLPKEVLAKAAIAAQMAPGSASTSSTSLSGNLSLNAKDLWRRLREQTRELKFGEQAIAVDDLQEYAGKLSRPGFNQNATDAIVYRATPSRGNQLVGGPAFMEALWRQRMIRGESESDYAASKEKIKGAVETCAGRQQPIISAFAPITITVTKGEKKTPLLIYKNYWGIVARDLRSGELAWEAASDWSLESMLNRTTDAHRSNALNSWLGYYTGPNNQYPQILFENSTIGSLSTDGQNVYAIDDLAVPPPPQMNANMGMGGVANTSSYNSDIDAAIASSRLQAFSLARSGAMIWQLGGNDGEKGLLSDCYFLGPPLPLGGKLYVLIEKQQEIRLVCLEAMDGPDAKDRYAKLISTQTLGTSNEKMQNDVTRRITAAHLAYGEGILVCPTNAGAVFGINLLENSLVWAYPYREKNDRPREMQPMGRIIRGGGGQVWMQLPNGQLVPANQVQSQGGGQDNRWKASAPVIAEGKVVFTAPDARSLHCINLRDGSPVWKQPKKDDDLYLGNVYNGTVLIVGKNHVRGLSLSSGETMWTLDTGVPSGQGVGSDNVYYLPLKSAGRAKDNEPQIMAIDVENGRIIGSSKSRPKSPERKDDYDVPGNLLFYEGNVISLTHEEVVVYPQLKAKIKQMDELIAKNPNDPAGLTARGELRLDKGDLTGAIDDLSAALRNKPDAETKKRAREKLYDTLTTYIADHFDDAEKHLKDYEELCRIDWKKAPKAEQKKLQAEERRRRAIYLWLVGKGREAQGRLVEAFENYQQFGAEAGRQQELVPAIDDRQVRAAPDVWSRGRIIAMMNKAKPEERAPLEKLIAAKWDKLRQSKDLEDLRRFVRLFGSVSAAGKEARLQLVDRLMEQPESADEHPLLEAELELNQFRTGEHPPELAGRATEALARLYLRKGLLEDAAWCYRRLGSDYAKVSIRDGKTGSDFFEDMTTDKRLLPYLDVPDPFGSIKLKAKKETGNFSMKSGQQLFRFEHIGERLPFFRRHEVGLNFNNHDFELIDRGSGESVWKQRLGDSMFQMLTMQVLGQNNNGWVMNRMGQMVPPPPPSYRTRFPYRTLGHLVVLPVGRMVYGIDPVHQRLLWQMDLGPDHTGKSSSANKPQPGNVNGRIVQKRMIGGVRNMGGPAVPAVDPRDGSVLFAYPDNWSQRVGQAGPLNGQTVCVQKSGKLAALDPLTGRVLWERQGISSSCFVFADEHHFFVVEWDQSDKPEDSKPTATYVFRAEDGIRVKAAEFGSVFANRRQVFGRFILASETGPTNNVLLRLYDPLAGQDAWKQSYPSRSIVLDSENPALTGMVEPNGKVHVIDLRTRKEVMSAKLENPAEDLKNVKRIQLLSDREFFYLACNASEDANNPAGGKPAAPAANNNGSTLSNVMTQLGMRTLPVNGKFYAFHRARNLDKNWYTFAPNQMLVLDQFEESPVVLMTARHAPGNNNNLGRWQGNNMVYTASVLSIEKRSGKALIGEEVNNNSVNFHAVRIDERAATVELISQNLKITHYPDPDAEVKSDGDKAVPRLESKVKQRTAIDRVRIQEIALPLPPR